MISNCFFKAMTSAQSSLVMSSLKNSFKALMESLEI